MERMDPGWCLTGWPVVLPESTASPRVTAGGSSAGASLGCQNRCFAAIGDSVGAFHDVGPAEVARIVTGWKVLMTHAACPNCYENMVGWHELALKPASRDLLSPAPWRGSGAMREAALAVRGPHSSTASARGSGVDVRGGTWRLCSQVALQVAPRGLHVLRCSRGARHCSPWPATDVSSGRDRRYVRWGCDRELSRVARRPRPRCASS